MAKISGLGQTGQQFCQLFGTTIPFTPEQITALYRNHGAFVSAWGKATKDAVDAGFVVKEDGQLIRVVGVQAGIGK